LKISKDLGRLTEVEPSYSIADGILVKSPSLTTFEVVREYVDDIVLVDDEEIATSLVLLLERSKTVVEPAGAASLAALLSGKVKAEGKKVITVLSGGNIDMSLMARIVDKTLYKTKRIVKVKVMVPDKPGYLNKVLSYVAQIRGNVIDVIHDRISSDVRPGYTKIYVMFEVAEQEALGTFLTKLQSENIEARLIE
jgi:Threonine dehydratase